MNNATRSRILRVSASLLSLAPMIACGRSATTSSSASQSQQEPASAAASAVQYVKVEPEPISDTLDLPAKVQADPTKLVRVFPPASGRVLAIDVKPGDRVRAGQTVALLQSADIGSARADYLKAQIENDRATRAAERQRNLLDHGAAAEKDYLEAKATADTAHAELERARQRLQLLNLPVSGTGDTMPLRAPTVGSVLDVSSGVGEFSKSLDNATPLVTIADLRSVWVVGDVYEKDAAAVRPGTPVTITLPAYPHERWSGRIASVSDALDPATRTLKARVVLANPDRRLKPEMFATLHLSGGSHRGLLVPQAAIVRQGNQATVFVQIQGMPVQRNVTLGATVGDKVEILTGLKPGDEVATEGAELLKGGPAS